MSQSIIHQHPGGAWIVGNGGSPLDASYDVSDGALKTVNIGTARFADVPQSLVDVANLAVGTYYYASVDGFSNFGFNNSLSFTGKISANAATTVTLTFEATNDEDTTDWIPVTELMTQNDGTTQNASLVVNDSVGTLYGFHLTNPPHWKYRAKVVISDSNVNTVTIKMYRKAQ